MKVRLEVLCDFSDQPGHTKFSAQQFSALLIFPYLTECHCTWVELAGFLDTSCERNFLFLSRQLLSRSFPSTFLIFFQVGGFLAASPIIFIIIIWVIIRCWPFLGSLCRLCGSSSQGREWIVLSITCLLSRHNHWFHRGWRSAPTS